MSVIRAIVHYGPLDDDTFHIHARDKDGSGGAHYSEIEPTFADSKDALRRGWVFFYHDHSDPVRAWRDHTGEDVRASSAPVP